MSLNSSLQSAYDSFVDRIKKGDDAVQRFESEFEQARAQADATHEQAIAVLSNIIGSEIPPDTQTIGQAVRFQIITLLANPVPTAPRSETQKVDVFATPRVPEVVSESAPPTQIPGFDFVSKV